MFFLYRIVLAVGFLVLLPKFLGDVVSKGKYAAGFKERLGFLPKYDPGGRKVVWLHCVSVGEANAARQLAVAIKHSCPEVSLVVSTTTSTGQHVAREAFGSVADLVFYFPFDFRSSVRRALRHINPSVVLLMETEIWFNFIRESHKSGASVVIVNGRISERSLARFSYINNFIKRVLGSVDLGLMQTNTDATRIMGLGLRGNKVKVTGNLKFDHNLEPAENELSFELRKRFGFSSDAPLIIAASTHSPEERWIIEAWKQVRQASGEAKPRLMIAPRHPERFDEVGKILDTTGLSWVRRTAKPSERDMMAQIILLDSIGELRAAYSHAEIVFVGGSLIPHGGQSIFEPAASGRAIVIGSHVANFEDAVREFLEKEAILQIDAVTESDVVQKLSSELTELLADRARRERLGSNALATIEANRGAVAKTIESLTPYLRDQSPFSRRGG